MYCCVYLGSVKVPDEDEDDEERHLVGHQGQRAVQVLHQLREPGSTGRDGMPAVLHHQVPDGK